MQVANTFESKIYIVPIHFGLFYVASTLCEYPNSERITSSLETLEELKLQTIADSIESTSWQKIKNFLYAHKEKNFEKLCNEYIQLFDINKSSNPLYESEYGRNRILAKGFEIADIAGFYKAFGFELEKADMHDHIALELEFYFHLCLKQVYQEEKGNKEGVQVLSDARVSFMNSHLGKFPEAILERTGVQENEFYKSVFQWISALVQKECSLLEIAPQKLNWIQDKPIDYSCCGSL